MPIMLDPLLIEENKRPLSPFEGGSERQRAGGCQEPRQISPYNKALKPFARQLRSGMTDAEVALWSKIRKRQIHGIQFLRQRPFGSFILDFYAKSIKLALEVDGAQHYRDNHKIKDENRDAYLAELSVYTLRFTNFEVLKQCSSVLGKMR